MRTSNTYRKTEQLLRLYPRLSDESPIKARIDAALEILKDCDHRDIIASRYFDGMTLEEIAEIYDCKYQTISKRNSKLVRKVACELFPDEVAQEIVSGEPSGR